MKTGFPCAILFALSLASPVRAAGGPGDLSYITGGVTVLSPPTAITTKISGTVSLRYLHLDYQYGTAVGYPTSGLEQVIVCQASNPTPTTFAFTSNTLAQCDDIAWFHTPKGKAIVVASAFADPVFGPQPITEVSNRQILQQFLMGMPATGGIASSNTGLFDPSYIVTSITSGILTPPTNPIISPYAATDIIFANNNTIIPKGSVLYMGSIWATYFSGPTWAILIPKLAIPQAVAVTGDIIAN
jgi:hypothetical protein